MKAFSFLKGKRRWVGWRNELRSNRLTKVPYTAAGRRAKADDPSTWRTRAEAETTAASIINGQGGGIGIELGDLGDHFLGGIDLDSCIDEAGCLSPWAEKILCELDTYAERSPSGTGIKALFFCVTEDARPFLDLIGVTEPDQWGIKRSVGADGRDHGPGIELYLAGRYFAVTDDLWPGKPDRIASLDWPVLEQLAKLIPRAGPTEKTRAAAGGADSSRSAKAFREGARLRREGKSFEEMVEALRRHPDTDILDWCREKGDASGGRELRRIWQRTEAAPADVAAIIVEAGKRHIAADQGISALVDAEVPFYQRNQKIVRIVLVKAKSSSGEILAVPGIASVDSAMMERELGRSAVWKRFDMKQKKHVTIDPPNPVASQILAMAGHWPFPPLHGIIHCPTLRSDGSLLDKEGYDVATGLVLIDGATMPPISLTPGREEAEAALDFLGGLLTEFPIPDAECKAVALSMFITPVIRGAMTVAPMHLVTAPLPASGKSYLIDCAAMIATGEVCAVESMAPKYEETEKRLIGAALSGFPIIGIDNVREIVAGDFFCQVVERPLMSLRALGSSDKQRIPNTFTVFANGNNATVAEDMVRRTIRCELDANVEHPEEREFAFNPLAAIQKDRGKYVAAALTIPLAYIAAGRPRTKPPLPSFRAWSRMVRDPLIWLGCGDPVATQTRLRSVDPRKADKTAVFDAWKSEIGVGPNTCCTTREIIATADTREKFRETLLAVAPQRFGDGKIDPKALGKWLSAQEGTIAAKCKLLADRTDQTRPKWYLDFHQ